MNIEEIKAFLSLIVDFDDFCYTRGRVKLKIIGRDYGGSTRRENVEYGGNGVHVNVSDAHFPLHQNNLFIYPLKN